MLLFDHPDFESVASREWIITNGIGGYASSSLCGANTRRYHGLLVASYNPPTDRRVLVSKIEETITVDEETMHISSNQYPGNIYPKGYQFLKSFERMPFPRSIFTAEKFSVSKSVFMIYGSNTTVVEYQNTGVDEFELALIPLLVYRDYHHLFHQEDDVLFNVELIDNGTLKIISRQGVSPFYIYFDKGEFFPDPDWYRHFIYFREEERGLDFTEDAKSIGRIRIQLAPGEKIHVILSTEEKLPDGIPVSWKIAEELRLQSLVPAISNKFIQDLIVSGDQFLVWRLNSRSHTLIAGYHWFTDWGRDTMIAIRGLIIAAGRKQAAVSILKTFISHIDAGMIPNRFPDQGEQPEYNTIDASLWLFIALYEYYKKFDEIEFIEESMPFLEKIIDAHYMGTRYHIQVTSEGLLYGGEPNVQLTWMDAKVGDHVVTSRHGCAVEINALWYNALSIYHEFCGLTNYPAGEIVNKIESTRTAFRKYFINEKGYLNDVVIPGSYFDDAIRPNQVYAISLPFSPLTPAESAMVLEVMEKHLYTDYGLRSLSPDHPDFKAVYKGDQWERDHAYHQGTVWAYLWGEYALAFLKVNIYSQESKDYIRQRSKALEHHFYNEDGLNAISEIFDGQNPLHGKGCIQQAWSVGMTIKALIECDR